MADEFGEPTMTLLKAARYLKDNRIPPRGFMLVDTDYQDIAILGAASKDDDFNRTNESDGTGSDIVHYQIKIPENTGNLTVEVGMYYQSLSPKFADNIFSHDHEDIVKFKGMYLASPRTPVQIAKSVLTVSATSVLDSEYKIPEFFSLQQNMPNPFNATTSISFNVMKPGEYCLSVYNVAGQRIDILLTEKLSPGKYNVNWNGTNHDGRKVPSGLYFYELRNSLLKSSKKMLLVE